MSSRLVQDLRTYLFRVFVFAPLTGAACGAITGFFGDLASGGEFGFVVLGAMFGIPTGFVFSVLSFWLLRDAALSNIAAYLVSGTLLFAIPVALIPEAIAVSWLSGMAGYWVGFLFLLTRLKFTYY
jgi:hypothetical protein